MLKDVHPADIERLLREERPMFLACVHRDEEYEQHRRVVEAATESLPAHVFALWAEVPRVSAVMLRLNIHGTPTYLVFDAYGEERGRLEGRADQEALERLLREANVLGAVTGSEDSA
ncbi:hypothetical protein SAMN02745704_01701 [Paucidesulfovibrio gracilis DSM 16080]|jgi:hypothetical protein|uniref:Thioredoxin n=1 Tax=Paucidesulfovibrio gracilis DSM 16080 TaxID=1121449 RepID=A0A1T4X2L6_9BACT|nr:hypothetical protein [Paucidesulfovibrio gracilis]SKA83687.1 hypothetical protein SAMN02745704_01701 [Paucidesulfovibrio gracilis DSM 16080]